MINVSDKLVFLTQGEVLKDGINEAIRITRQRLFDIYSEGELVSAENITSTSKRVPKTHNLAFCKFFDGGDIFLQDATLIAENLLNKCNELTDAGKQNRNLNQLLFEGILPNFETARKKLPAIFSHEVKRGILIMLFVLWKNRHILLTTNYSMPTYKVYGNSSPISMCEPFYTEVIAFFQSFRQQVIPGTSKIIPSEGLTPSIQTTIQSYAFRVVVASDWHSVEDVKLEDCVVFLDNMRLVKIDGSENSYPIQSMAKLLEHYTQRLGFTSEELAIVRHHHERPLGAPATAGELRPKTIKKMFICEPISGKEIHANNPEWINSQLSYVSSMGKRNKGTKDLEGSLTILNDFLFFVIPDNRRKNGDADISPPKPSEFDRRYFNDNDTHPTLRDHIETRGNADSTVVRRLSLIIFNKSMPSIE